MSKARKGSRARVPASAGKAAAASGRTTAKRSIARKSASADLPSKSSTGKKYAAEVEARSMKSKRPVNPVEKPDAAKPHAAKSQSAKIASKSGVKPTTKAVTKAINKPVGPTTKEKLLSSGGKKANVEVVLDPDYRPSDDEPFMNQRQRLYFRNKLKTWKEDIIRQTRETLAGLHEDSTQHADLADRATSETDRALELRARDRQRKLIAKIDAALARIEDGSYGYCEETGEPIGLKRLDARPIATLSVEAQERHERRERVYRED